MALRMVPAGDERCDIHNGRRPPQFICQDCAKEMGVQTPGVRTRARGIRRRIRHRWSHMDGRVRFGLVAAVVVAIGIVVAVSVLGGGGTDKIKDPTQEDVVNALNLSPDPNGAGWITLDGACGVLTIDVGARPLATASQGATTVTTPTGAPSVIATNETGTVRAVVVTAFSNDEAACVQRVESELRAHF